MMLQTIPSLKPFIRWCKRIDSLLHELGTLSSPALFPLRLQGATVTEEMVATRIDSLQCLAFTLCQYQHVATAFGFVDPDGLPCAPPSQDDLDDDPTSITNPEREYTAITMALDEWRCENQLPASKRKHNNYYHLSHLGHEFFCLAAATESLRDLHMAGTAILRDPSSLSQRKSFAKSMRSILELHRSELGKIRKKGVRSGIPFAHQKLLAYARSCKRLAPYLLRRAEIIDESTLIAPLEDPKEQKRKELMTWLRSLTKYVPSSEARGAFLDRLDNLTIAVTSCEKADQFDKALTLARGVSKVFEKYKLLPQIAEVFI